METMDSQANNSSLAALTHVLEEATVEDLEFAEQHISTHSETGETKIGCSPVAVRSVTVPNPGLIVYVRARDAKGEYWYVLNWSQLDPSGRPREVLVSSESEAKEVVLAGLKVAVAQEVSNETT